MLGHPVPIAGHPIAIYDWMFVTVAFADCNVTANSRYDVVIDVESRYGIGIVTYLTDLVLDVEPAD